VTQGADVVAGNRRKLLAKDTKAIEEALLMLRTKGTRKGWHILEGPTYPDAFLITPDALIVVEGKRTEAGPTLDTSWMSGRHQMLRHLDAAWEIRGARSVYGILIVEAKKETDSIAVPPLWETAAADITSPEALASSLPHRGPEEQTGIARSFVGVTTWQAVCHSFRISEKVLLHTA
jgi:hypothetical protein